MKSTHLTRVAGLALLCVALAACGGGAPGPDATEGSAGAPGDTTGGIPPSGGGTPPPTGGDATTLQGGVWVRIEQAGEVFAVWVTEPAAAQALMDISSGRAAFQSIGGVLLPGAGPGAHNTPWTWHLDPAAVYVNAAAPAGRAYTGTPSQVEANATALIAAGMHKVTTPADARITHFADRRGDVPTLPPEVPLPR